MIRPTVQENAARYADCIAACNACAAAALKCAAACLEEQDVRRMARCIALDMDCAGIAQLVCEDCAEVCKWCKEECERHDAEHCQECARACAVCMEQCLKMTA
ncbi:putative cysteine-rich protein YhjQ [compost metagenome]